MSIRIINADVMDGREFLDGRVALLPGDCLEVMRKLPEAAVDSIVTDPPYALTQASRNGSPRNNDPETPFGRTKLGERGFMGKTWDTGEVAFLVEFWIEALRVLKPGGHLVAFGGTRTYHRLAVAIEDAGFEIRDQLAWAYGSGFPKSLDVSKAIDKAAGAEREVVGPAPYSRGRASQSYSETRRVSYDYPPLPITAAATDEAKQWSGWGTALKPAWEPICLARKPLIGTVAANVVAHGTGGLNIDGCRVELNGDYKCRANGRPSQTGLGDNYDPAKANQPDTIGRFPANLIHDGSDEVESLFPEAPGQQADVSTTAPSPKTSTVYGKMSRAGEASADRRYTDEGSTNFAALPGQRRGDSGSAARFFYTAKADADDRIASKHPTVKPVDLMQWLVRLVTKKGGTVLDPFAGTGTTGEAAWREGMNAVLIEREAEYQADIARRMDLADKPTKKASVVATAKKGEAPRGGLLDLMEAAE